MFLVKLVLHHACWYALLGPQTGALFTRLPGNQRVDISVGPAATPAPVAPE